MAHEFYALKDVKARGWSPKLIETILGAPDQFKRNPTRRSGPPMQLWLRRRVEATEHASPEFIAYQVKRAAASIRSKQAAERKRVQLRADIDTLVVTVQVIPVEEAITRGVKNWRTRKSGRRKRAPGNTADGATKRRWAVNYIRHHLCAYDAELAQIFGRIGKQEGVRLIRVKVYTAIAAAYPAFAGECHRQMARRE
jgi:hypothetical protein